MNIVEEIMKNRSDVFLLNRQQMKEKDYTKKREINQEIKTKAEEILKITPDDTDMSIKLMFANISLNQVDEARKIAYQLYERLQIKDVLNGLAIVEEKLGNYEQSLEFLEQMSQREPNNEYIKAKIERVKGKQDRTSEKSQEISSKQYKYRQIADLERKVRAIAEQEQKKTIMRWS